MQTVCCCSRLVVLALGEEGLMSMYSKIFEVASLGAFPCAIATIACSDCATIAHARSFLWIE